MPGIRARTTCALAVAACVFAFGACGNDDESTIPREEGEVLLAQLAAIEDAVGNGLCEAARSSAVEFATAVSELPEEVDPEVRAALVEASANLAELADDPTQCKSADTGTTDVVEPTTPPTTSTTTTSSTTEETTTEEPEEEEPEDKPGNGPPDTPPGHDDSGDGGSDGGSSGGIGTDG